MERRLLCILLLISSIGFGMLNFTEGDNTKVVWKIGHRSKRGTMTPCLRCTVLNKRECCQKFNRCCETDSTQVTNINNSRKVKPAVVNNQQQVNQQQRPGKSNAIIVRSGSCPLRNRNILLGSQCNSYCSRNSQCASASRCCPRSSVLSRSCCRPLDIQGNCPQASCSNCCRRCSSAGDCPAGEGCCSATAVRGCCARGCGSSNTINSVGTTDYTRTVITNPHEDLETVRIPVTESWPSKPGSIKTVFLTETIIQNNGYTETVTETVWNNGGDDHVVTVTQHESDDHVVTVTQHGGDDHVVTVTHEDQDHVVTVIAEHEHEITLTETRTVLETKTLEGPPVTLEETIEITVPGPAVTVTGTPPLHDVIYTTVGGDGIVESTIVTVTRTA